MSTLRTRIATIAISAAVVFTSLMPAQAFQAPQRVETTSDGLVTKVESDQLRFSRNIRRHNGGGDYTLRRYDRRNGGDYSERRYDRRHGDRVWRHDGGRSGYYNGHRGYRGYRSGYREHNGYWFPLAAFGAGAIIGGAIASEPRAVYSGSMSPSHVNWCENRYRSYRAYDNSYQPNYGGRRACNSPYS